MNSTIRFPFSVDGISSQESSESQIEKQLNDITTYDAVRWRNYICDVQNYGYAKINYICCGKTYEDCKQHLIESIEMHSPVRLN